ncbi:MAG: hypothetical protein ACLFT0_12260 [Spirulinaceae cyanobacterium]
MTPTPSLPIDDKPTVAIIAYLPIPKTGKMMNWSEIAIALKLPSILEKADTL